MSLNRSDTQIQGEVGAKLMPAIQQAGLVAAILGLIPAAIATYGAVSDWNEECDQPLKWVLVIYAAIAFTMTLVSGASFLMMPKLDKDDLRYNARKNKAQAEGKTFEVDPEIEEKL